VLRAPGAAARELLVTVIGQAVVVGAACWLAAVLVIRVRHR